MGHERGSREKGGLGVKRDGRDRMLEGERTKGQFFSDRVDMTS